MEKGGVEGGCLDEICGGDGRFLMRKKVVFKDVEKEEEKGLVKNVCFSDESSSIGKNSDVSENSMENSGDGEEVQSSYKGALDAMEALEEFLPIRQNKILMGQQGSFLGSSTTHPGTLGLTIITIHKVDEYKPHKPKHQCRRGISRFYNGRSKSFTTLSDSSSLSSIKDLAKPDNAYMRRRRNLLACSLNWDKNRSCSPLRSNGGGISKRMTGSPRTTLALAVAMSNSDMDKQGGECNSAGSLAVSSPRRNFPVWRSMSYAHLHPCASVANTYTDSNQTATETS
ncbi:UNVERIFIED_CONTAM: hypothetical protein Slati_1862300 [Sesamum latifolium]|uniref:Uncharacterized protein n=1 Tax=Sesamum latifolium TaxID=2727402 RepID=A0AAW2X242_9LAMI